MSEFHTQPETIVPFNCGICSKPLTDRTALLTSCGHFFCASPKTTCTLLRPSAPAGNCEQCGKKCDAGTLANQASGYDQRVKSFVFDDVVALTQKLADILKFRETHRTILNDNAALNLQLMNKLKTECRKLKEEAESARTERDNLRAENIKLRKSYENLNNDNKALRGNNGTIGANPAERPEQNNRLKNKRWTPSPPDVQNNRRPHSSNNVVTSVRHAHASVRTDALKNPCRTDRPRHCSNFVSSYPRREPANHNARHLIRGNSRRHVNHSRAVIDQSRSWRPESRFKRGGVSVLGASVMRPAGSRFVNRRRVFRGHESSAIVSKPAQARASLVTGFTYAKRSTDDGLKAAFASSHWQNRGLTVPRSVVKQNSFRNT